MIIQKTGVFKFLRYLGIFCALAMGFVSIVATSEEDAADALGIDTSFNETVYLSSGEVTVDKENEVVAEELFKNCSEILSVEGLLMQHEDWEDIQEVDMESQTFPANGKVRVRYKDAMTDPALKAFTCSVRIIETGVPLDDSERATYDVSTPSYDVVLQQTTYSDWIDVTPSQELVDAISYFVDPKYQAAEFMVCSYCTVDLNEVDDWSVTTEAEFPLQLKGDLL